MVHDNREELTGVLIDNMKQLENTAAHGFVELEVKRSDMVQPKRRAPFGRDGRFTGPAALPTLRVHLQALLTPQTVDLL